MGLKGKRKSTGPRPAWRHKQEREVSHNPGIHYKRSTYPGWAEAFHRKLYLRKPACVFAQLRVLFSNYRVWLSGDFL